MKNFKKKDFPVHQIRRFLEPGPIVLVSSKWKDKTNIMTMGWYSLLEFSPSLIGCMISSGNHSHNLIKKSGECVLNLPTADLGRQLAGIGNSDGDQIDKFEEFGLTAIDGAVVKAPMIQECYANFECRLADKKFLNQYNFFVFEVVKAHVAVSPKYPETLHYRGDGVFMTSGNHVSYKRYFRPENL